MTININRLNLYQAERIVLPDSPPCHQDVTKLMMLCSITPLRNTQNSSSKLTEASEESSASDLELAEGNNTEPGL
jgi:hypothetical protein